MRLEKANRNYALNYIRNGLSELANAMDGQEAAALANRAATLIGLQYFQETAGMIGAQDGDLDDFAHYLTCMFRGMGDEVSVSARAGGLEIEHEGLRVIRGLPDDEADLVFRCWAALWQARLGPSGR